MAGRLVFRPSFLQSLKSQSTSVVGRLLSRQLCRTQHPPAKLVTENPHPGWNTEQVLYMSQERKSQQSLTRPRPRPSRAIAAGPSAKKGEKPCSPTISLSAIHGHAASASYSKLDTRNSKLTHLAQTE